MIVITLKNNKLYIYLKHNKTYKLSVSMFRLIKWLIKTFPNVYIRLITTYIGLCDVSIVFIVVYITINLL